jgi:hypothetical protein
VAAAAPAVQLSGADLRRGRRTLDLRGTRPFSGGGLTGTVRSTLIARVGAVGPADLLGDEPADDTPPARWRRITVRYAVERVDGAATYELAGTEAVELCAPLDSCGALGRTTIAPRATRGVVALTVISRASVPARRLRQVVGLAPARTSLDDFGAFALGGWREGGSVTAQLTREGAEPCADVAPLDRATLVVVGADAQALVSLVETGSLRTRCGGPFVTEGSEPFTLQGFVPMRDLGRERVTMHLRSAGAGRADGYIVTGVADVRIVLRRLSVRERIVRG